MMLHAAGLAFYMIFSLAPLMIILVALSGWIFGDQAAAGQLSEFMEDLMGAELALVIEGFVNSVVQQQAGVWATLLGTGILVFAATTVIAQLKDSLNAVWNVKTKQGEGLKAFLVDRFLALGFILALAGILGCLVMVDAILAFLGPWLEGWIPGGTTFWAILNSMLALVVTTLLFAIIYKFLPDIRVKWSDVWIGALVTAVLFWVGRVAIGIYLASGAVASAYGAAGSVVVFLVWVYYNAMVVFIGAEFTRVYSTRYGATVETRRFVRFMTRDIPEWAKRVPRKPLEKLERKFKERREAKGTSSAGREEKPGREPTSRRKKRD